MNSDRLKWRKRIHVIGLFLWRSISDPKKTCNCNLCCSKCQNLYISSFSNHINHYICIAYSKLSHVETFYSLCIGRWLCMSKLPQRISLRGKWSHQYLWQSTKYIRETHRYTLDSRLYVASLLRFSFWFSFEKLRKSGRLAITSTVTYQTRTSEWDLN